MWLPFCHKQPSYEAHFSHCKGGYSISPLPSCPPPYSMVMRCNNGINCVASFIFVCRLRQYLKLSVRGEGDDDSGYNGRRGGKQEIKDC